jgi:predicted ribosomally synthesized peptide with SipW-like signal peptide
MRRSRWPDVVLVVGVLALLAGGVWALWADDVKDWLGIEEPAAEPGRPASTGAT